MDKEMLDILNGLSKKPTTELALQIMELSGENLILEQQCKKQKEVIDKLNFIKNRKNQGASQENINKMAIEFVNNYLKEVSE